MGSVYYDDKWLREAGTSLRKLEESLSPKQVTAAIRGGVRREANRVRKVVIRNIRGSLRSNHTLEKGVRVEMYKKIPGFRVTIRTKKHKGKRPKTSRQQTLEEAGLVLLWNEEGTKPRKTKSRTKLWKRTRRGHYTGQLKGKQFVQRAYVSERNVIERNVFDEVKRNVEKALKKYGKK